MTCSKRILVVSYICGILLTIITVVGVFIGYEMSTIATITGIAWGEISVSNAFYYNKAKRENAIKIALNIIKNGNIAEKDDLVNLISVIKD